MADQVLYQAVRGVSDLINYQGLVNVDFADIQTIMKNKGIALMGAGTGSGEQRLMDAAQEAINSPLLDDVSLAGATSILMNITGGPSLTMLEVSEASTMIQEEAHEDANVIWGWVVNEEMEDRVEVTVIATGFEEELLGNRSVKPQKKDTPQRTGNRPSQRGRTPARETSRRPMSGRGDYGINPFKKK